MHYTWDIVRDIFTFKDLPFVAVPTDHHMRFPSVNLACNIERQWLRFKQATRALTNTGAAALIDLRSSYLRHFHDQTLGLPDEFGKALPFYPGSELLKSSPALQQSDASCHDANHFKRMNALDRSQGSEPDSSKDGEPSHKVCEFIGPTSPRSTRSANAGIRQQRARSLPTIVERERLDVLIHDCLQNRRVVR